MAQRLSYNYVKGYIESFNYTLLSENYKNTSTKILIKCPNNHQYSVTFRCFKQGRRCPICNINTRKLSYNYINNYITSREYILLSKTYENRTQKLLLQCPNNHQYRVLFSCFKQGYRCPICNNTKRKLLLQINVKSFIENVGYKLLSDNFDNKKQKLSIQCDKGHQYKSTFNAFQQGCRCPICWTNSSSSRGEKEVGQFVKSLGINIVENDRTQILNPLTNKNLELDIWIPKLKKAIEYNGEYWHSFINKQQNDKIKQQQCKKLGINLLIVHEENWQNNQKIEQQIIRNFING